MKIFIRLGLNGYLVTYREFPTVKAESEIQFPLGLTIRFIRKNHITLIISVFRVVVEFILVRSGIRSGLLRPSNGKELQAINWFKLISLCIQNPDPHLVVTGIQLAI